MSHHMNNIEYIKLALNVFTDDFLLAHEPDSLEVHYTGESKEGQTLRVYSRTKDSSTQIIIKESDRSVFEMKINLNNGSKLRNPEIPTTLNEYPCGR